MYIVLYMKNINIILATSTDYGIGYDNKLCWNIPEELQNFRKITIGNKKNCVIMGKNTWYSLPNGPLKHRINVIISNTDFEKVSRECYDKDVIVKRSIEDAFEFVERDDDIDDVFIIGGAQLYDYCLNKFIHKINKIYMSIIYDKNYICDKFVKADNIYKHFRFDKENIHFTERYAFMIGYNKNKTINNIDIDEPID